jgi:hypothetical protein
MLITMEIEVDDNQQFEGDLTRAVELERKGDASCEEERKLALIELVK